MKMIEATSQKNAHEWTEIYVRQGAYIYLSIQQNKGQCFDHLADHGQNVCAV